MTYLPYILGTLFLSIYQEEWKHLSIQKYVCEFIATLFIIAKNWDNTNVQQIVIYPHDKILFNNKKEQAWVQQHDFLKESSGKMHPV